MRILIFAGLVLVFALGLFGQFRGTLPATLHALVSK